MSAQIVVPELGESVKDARVARWLKHEGDEVAAGEAVVELETEKTDLEIGASDTGVLARIEHDEGDDVKIGEVLAIIEPKAEGEGQAPEPARQRPPAERPAGEEKTARPRPVQPAGDGRGGRLVDTDRREQEERRRPEGKAAEEPRPEHATPSERRRARGEERATPAEAAQPAPVAEPELPAPPETAARREGPEPTPAPAVEARALPLDRSRLEERVRLSKRRLTIAARLLEAQRTAAMLTTFNEVDMSEVVALRTKHRETFRERHGVGLGIVAFFVKASVVALREFPWLNAEMQDQEAVLKYYYDIGVAVGASEGLVVPVLRDADRLSFVEIERAIKDLAERAEARRLTLAELRGGTFTITNGGVFGSLMSTPMLNPPQVAILGLHRFEDRVRPVNGIVSVRPMMYLALTYDHRLVDGRDAVRFLARIRELVEDPYRLVLEA